MNYIAFIFDSFYLVLHFTYLICKYLYTNVAIVKPLQFSFYCKIAGYH